MVRRTADRPRRASARCSAASRRARSRSSSATTDGDPVVIRNAPLLDDGTPMPTRYWLVGRAEVLAVSRLEAAGGVRARRGRGRRRRRSPTPTRATPPSATPPSRPAPPAAPVGRRRRHPTGRQVPARPLRLAPRRRRRPGRAGGSPRGSTEPARRRRRPRHSTPFSPRRPRHADPASDAASLLGDRPRRRRPAAPAQLTNAIGAVDDHLDDVVRELPAIADGSRRPRVAAPSRGTSPPSSAAARRRSERRRRPRRRRGRVPHARHRAPRRPRWHNPGLDPARVDTVLGDVLRRGRGDAPAAARPASLTFEAAARPDGRVTRPPAARQPDAAPAVRPAGRCCARSRRPTSRRGARSAGATTTWLTPWEPRRPPQAARPARCTATRSSPGARHATATAQPGVAFGVRRVRRQPPRRRGQPQQRPARRDAERHVGYWIDQAHGRPQRYIAEGVVVLAAFAFEQLDLHRLEICIVPRNDNSRRVMEKLATPRGRRRPALPRDQRRLGGPRPLRVHRRGVDRAPRRARRHLVLTVESADVGAARRPTLEAVRSPARRTASALRLADRRCAASTSSSSSAAWRGRAWRPSPWRPRGRGGASASTPRPARGRRRGRARRSPGWPRPAARRGSDAARCGRGLAAPSCGGTGTSAVRWRWLIGYLLVTLQRALSSGGPELLPVAVRPLLGARSGAACLEIFACSAARRSANHGWRGAPHLRLELALRRRPGGRRRRPSPGSSPS